MLVLWWKVGKVASLPRGRGFNPSYSHHWKKDCPGRGKNWDLMVIVYFIAQKQCLRPLVYCAPLQSSFLSAAIGQRITECWNPTSDLLLHRPSLYWLSYRAIDNLTVKIEFHISPQTLDQYWLTLMFNLGFEPRISGIVSICSANWATSAAPVTDFFVLKEWSQKKFHSLR